LRLILDPFKRVILFFKAMDRIDFPATPKNAYGMPLTDFVLPDYELILTSRSNRAFFYSQAPLTTDEQACWAAYVSHQAI
jgi:hypothetical protein